MIIISWVFSGWPPIDFELNLPPRVGIVQAEVTPLQFDNKVIDFTFTDDNTDESLIIKTDKKTYIGLSRGEVYFSVTNIGDKSESVNLQAYFPTNSGEVRQIAKWTKNISYGVNVSEHASISYFCEEGWIKDVADPNNNLQCILFDEEGICAKYGYIGGQNSESLGYQCFSSSDIQSCNALSEGGQN
ncbi:hypothetical protein K8R42_03220, partial [bacterium]|nr:hypothetical protein [bacterium]